VPGKRGASPSRAPGVYWAKLQGGVKGQGLPLFDWKEATVVVMISRRLSEARSDWSCRGDTALGGMGRMTAQPLSGGQTFGSCAFQGTGCGEPRFWCSIERDRRECAWCVMGVSLCGHGMVLQVASAVVVHCAGCGQQMGARARIFPWGWRLLPMPPDRLTQPVVYCSRHDRAVRCHNHAHPSESLALDPGRAVVFFVAKVGGGGERQGPLIVVSQKHCKYTRAQV